MIAVATSWIAPRTMNTVARIATAFVITRSCDEHGEPNVWFCSNSTFVWGVMDLSRRELRTWLELVETNFPHKPELASDTRGRLLAAGKSYRRR